MYDRTKDIREVFVLPTFLTHGHVVITGNFSELDLSYEDSNELLYKSLWHYVAETFLASLTLTKTSKESSF